jgi:MFS transporter, OPA family, solute carrier family 37 (glycerol-3-phosphate transporter), member 1/2
LAPRKPISVVKNELLTCQTNNESSSCESWISELENVDEGKAHQLLGVLDSTYLFSYAFFMFVSGVVAERVNLRYFLSLGMIVAGVFTSLFGLAKFVDVHGIAFFVAVQFFGGLFQSTGWPSVVTVVANWFGSEKKGLIFGIWNSHTSVGNILGSFLAGIFVEDDWGLSFIVPGCLISCFGFVIWFSMIAEPSEVGIELKKTSSSQEKLTARCQS